jgi:hypothetical protein
LPALSWRLAIWITLGQSDKNRYAPRHSATLVLETSVLYDYFSDFITQLRFSLRHKKIANGKPTYWWPLRKCFFDRESIAVGRWTGYVWLLCVLLEELADVWCFFVAFVFCTVGEASGKASKGLAKHIPGSGGVQHLQEKAGAAGGEIARARLVRLFFFLI